MTAKQIYKYLLIELGKVNAPSLKLYEFNYYINKAITQYINLVYSTYETNQQAVDDLRVLQASVHLVPIKISSSEMPLISDPTVSGNSLFSGAYECYLPMDYLHMLNCVCTFQNTKTSGCNGEGECRYKPATRLTSDAWPIVMDDVYNRPSVDRPYFQIYTQSRNVGSALPIDPIETRENIEIGDIDTVGTDINGIYGVDEYDSDTLADGDVPGGNRKRTFTFKNGHKASLVEKTAAMRIDSAPAARLEIRCGSSTLYTLREIQVDYLRIPQYIRLSQEQLDLTEDVSQIMEWPDYVCQEIINNLLLLILERTQNAARLQTAQANNTTISRNLTAS